MQLFIKIISGTSAMESLLQALPIIGRQLSLNCAPTLPHMEIRDEFLIWVDVEFNLKFTCSQFTGQAK